MNTVWKHVESAPGKSSKITLKRVGNCLENTLKCILKSFRKCFEENLSQSLGTILKQFETLFMAIRKSLETLCKSSNLAVFRWFPYIV